MKHHFEKETVYEADSFLELRAVVETDSNIMWRFKTTVYSAEGEVLDVKRFKTLERASAYADDSLNFGIKPWDDL